MCVQLVVNFGRMRRKTDHDNQLSIFVSRLINSRFYEKDILGGSSSLFCNAFISFHPSFEPMNRPCFLASLPLDGTLKSLVFPMDQPNYWFIIKPISTLVWNTAMKIALPHNLSPTPPTDSAFPGFEQWKTVLRTLLWIHRRSLWIEMMSHEGKRRKDKRTRDSLRTLWT